MILGTPAPYLRLGRVYCEWGRLGGKPATGDTGIDVAKRAGGQDSSTERAATSWTEDGCAREGLEPRVASCWE